ncbi:MAG: M48 family metalloprotease [Acidobacteriota bacterium]|jgi:Zn-dependent protease with chaperone function|nr:M48 family metalloprotease [Acidobacteriota bacterium]
MEIASGGGRREASRLRRWLAAISLAVACLAHPGFAAAQGGGAQRQAEAFAARWWELVATGAAAGGGAADTAVDPRRRVEFDRLASDWREALAGVGADGAKVRARGWMDRHRSLHVVLEAVADSGGRVAGPAGFTLEPDGGRPVVRDVRGRPWLPAPPLAACILVLLSYLFLPPLLFRGVSRRAWFARPPSAESWSRRQAGVLACSLGGIPSFAAFFAGSHAAGGASLWFAWMAFACGGAMDSFEAGFSISFLCLYAAGAFVFYRGCFKMAQGCADGFRKGSGPPRPRRGKVFGNPMAVRLLVLAGLSAAFLPGVIHLVLAGSGSGALLACLCLAAALVIGCQAAEAAMFRKLAHKVLGDDDPVVRGALGVFGKVGGGAPARKVYVLPEDVWPAPNAFVTGFGRKRCVIGVTEALLGTTTPEETAAVLLHEYAHFWERHVALLLASNALLVAGAFVFFFEGVGWMRAAGVPYPSSLTHPIHYFASFGGFLLASAFVMPRMSRLCERRADALVRKLGEGEALASALLKMGDAAKMPLRWPRWLRWAMTHPSFEERVAFLKARPSPHPATPAAVSVKGGRGWR